MLIRVKVDTVEIEYSEPTNETDFPKCTSRDRAKEINGCDTKHDALLKTISHMADKANEIHRNIQY